MTNFRLFKGEKLLVDFSTEVTQLSDEQIQSVTKYDNCPIVKYELVFNENVPMSQIHDLENLKPYMIKSATVTISDVSDK